MPPGSLTSTVLSLPPATRLLTALLISFSTLLFLLRLSSPDPSSKNNIKGVLGVNGKDDDNTLLWPWLVLVPGNVGWHPWTLITAGWVEGNLVEFLISLLTLPLCGRYLERVWGQTEFLKFVFVTIVASNVIAVIVNVVESVVLGMPGLFLHGMSYHGLMGLQVGFLVAFTQLIPEHQVQVFGGLMKVRVKSLPMLHVTISNIACILGFQSPYILIQFGWLASWFYLRFVKWNEGGDFRGDRSETFAFQNWFPPFAQKYVAKLSNFVFGLAVRFGLITPWSDIEQGSTAYSSVPGGARAEAERRRAMALKALDQRMASKPATTTAPILPQTTTTGGGGGGGSSGSPHAVSGSPRVSVVAEDLEMGVVVGSEEKKDKDKIMVPPLGPMGEEKVKD